MECNAQHRYRTILTQSNAPLLIPITTKHSNSNIPPTASAIPTQATLENLLLAPKPLSTYIYHNQPAPMMTETLEKTYTIEEYFALEDRSEEKLEYHNGKIITLSGGTTDHSKIAVKIITALSILLDDQPFEVYNSDIKIQIPAYNKFVYSDVAVVSGSPEYYQGRRDTITNPLLVVEILSPSAARPYG